MIDPTVPTTVMMVTNLIVVLSKYPNLFYNAGVWLRSHWPEVVSSLEDPVNLTLLGAAAVVAIAVGVSTARLGAWFFYRTCRAFDSRPGVITVGRRRVGALDWVLNPPVRLSFVARCMHVQIVAPTRQGKTTLVLNWARQDFEEGHTVFVLQVGGDLGGQMLRIAYEVGVPVSYFNPADPGGIKWNPVATGPGNDVERVAEQAAATLETVSVSSDPYYQSVNTGMLRRMIFAAETYARSVGYNSDLILVKRFLEDDGYLREALQVDRDAGGGQRVNLPGLDLATRRWFENTYFAWNTEQRQRNASGLYLLFDEMLGRDTVVDALSPVAGEGALDLATALAHPGLVLFDIPAAKIGAAPSVALGLWALQRFQLETLDRVGPHVPLAAYFDEVHALLGGSDTRAANSFARWLPQVGKYGVAVHLAYQGFAMLTPDLRRVVDNNASNKLISGRLSAEDAHVAQELLGTVEKEEREVRRTHSPPFSGTSRAVTTTKKVEKWRYSVEQIRKLGRGKWFFVGVENGNLKDPSIIQISKQP